ncbi:hypothetical protein EDC01DRAFT_716380 [Geopyxis carbonaria]|nr:hypothetical protein EDC01DRAFT_716380 [Geopyxis carbonaria]
MSAVGKSANCVRSGDGDARNTEAWLPGIPHILPHGKVFTIQIGSESFLLSGASISSDAPSYFSEWFGRQLANQDDKQHVKPLYIDRDPETFRDIVRHLQGYHIAPRDGPHFVRLFADAQFYRIPKLMSQLFESEIFISIGSQHFQINRDLFNSPGNSPNYFTLGFAVFFSSPGEVFPGLNREGLLRPPSILPPEVPGRSAEIFREILHLLRGYPVQIRSPEHRQQLLRDCKYFHLKGLEQTLIPHEISYNPKRGRHEILIRLEDIKPSGISFCADHPAPPPDGSGRPVYVPGWVHYARPYVDEQPRELILEISGEHTHIDWRHSRAEFIGTTNQLITGLLQVITNKLALPISTEWPMGLKMIERMNNVNTSSTGPSSPGNTPLSDDKVKVHLGPECYISMDGEEFYDREGIPTVEIERENATSIDAGVFDGRTGSDTGRSEGVGGGGGGASPIIWPNSQYGSLSRPASTKSQSVGPSSHPRKRLKRKGSMEEGGEWMIKRGQWRLRIQTVHGPDGRATRLEAIMVGVKLEAFSGEHGRNSSRAFLN